MNNGIFIALLAAAAIALTACGKSEEPAKEMAAPETGAVEEQKSAVEQAMGSMKKEGQEAAEGTSQMATAAMEKGGEMADAAAAEAGGLIQQATDYIAENKIDLANGVMEQLRTLKDSLPESLQAQIDNLEQMLSSAQGGAE